MQIHNNKALPILLAAACWLGTTHAQTPSAPQEEASFSVTGFSVQGDNPLPEALTQSTLAPYVGTHNGIERLQDAAGALEAVLRTRGFGFYRVVLPPQDIGGVIKLQMYKFALGTVEVKGNLVFSNDNILRSLPQLGGSNSPNTHELARDLSVANENPSKRAKVTFRQGTVADTIDATVDVVDSKTFTGFIAANNTGDSATGYGRVTAGVSHTNLFDLDHQATLTYTTSPSDPGRVHQFGGYYKAPVYAWGGVVTAYYTNSSVASGVVGGVFDVTGRGEFAGLQYTHYFAPEGDFRSFASLTLDDKNFLNDKIVPVGGGTPLTPNYRTRPITLSYTGRMDQKWGLWGYNLDYARNLPWGGGNDNASYAANQAGASTNWSAIRFGADLTTPLPAEWLFIARMRGQLSGQPLVPGERFGVGGAQSIRGLNERALAGDTGLQANFEFWTPALAENTRALLFYDFGRIYRHNDALLDAATVGSLGVGVRWNLGTSLSANLDYGHVIAGLGKLPVGTSRDKVHFSMNWRY